MSYSAEDVKQLRAEDRAFRAAKRKSGAERLIKEGILFDCHNDGAHLIIYRQGYTIDYWPGTSRWSIRGGAKKFGLEALVKHIKGE